MWTMNRDELHEATFPEMRRIARLSHIGDTEAVADVVKTVRARVASSRKTTARTHVAPAAAQVAPAPTVGLDVYLRTHDAYVQLLSDYARVQTDAAFAGAFAATGIIAFILVLVGVL